MPDAAFERPDRREFLKRIGLGGALPALVTPGPLNATGILAGRGNLIAAARAQASPHSGIGRGMKVDKEEIVGLLAAVDRFLALDHDAVLRRQRELAAAMRASLDDIPGLELADDDKQGPGILLRWDEADILLPYAEFARRMREGDPPIVVWTARILAFSGEPTLYTASLQDGEGEVVARRAREVLLFPARPDG